MNNDIIEKQLQQLGESLRNRESITDQMLKNLGEQPQKNQRDKQHAERGSTGFKSRWFAFAASLAVVACCLGVMLFSLFSRPQVSWGQMTRAVQEQEWIRGTAEGKNGKRTVWVSTKNNKWAINFSSTKIFCNQTKKIKYEYIDWEKTITKLPVDDHTIEKVLPVTALSQDKKAIEPWLFGTEKVISQKRKVVSEKGKKWIEFELLMWRGSMRNAVLRVDPKTKLPVRLTFSSNGSSETSVWEFDYPLRGPSDIYAMGVPRDTKIVDLIPDKRTQLLLKELKQNRNRIEDFRMVVRRSPERLAMVVFKKGRKWRVDYCSWNSTTLIPELSNDGWYDGKLPGVHSAPLYVSDGTEVWQNTNFRVGQKTNWKKSEYVGPRNLLNGEDLGNMTLAPYTKLISALYPKIEPRKGWKLSVDYKPKGHKGKVLIKTSVELAGGKSFGHNWYYLNPAKGHAVDRIELFTTTDGNAEDKNSIIDWQVITMDDFFQSKKGVWLCRKATFPHYPIDKATATYHFDFPNKLDDKLFKLPSDKAEKK